MDLKTFHDLLDFALRKNQGGFLSPEEKDLMINRAQSEVYNEFKPAYGINQQVNDLMLPFKKEQAFNAASSAGGTVTLNADYEHLLAVETEYIDASGTQYIPVEILGEDEISKRKSSALIPLNSYNPCGLLKSATAIGGQKKLQLYPAQTTTGTIYYLRKPQDVQFVYTLSGRTITYNQASSKQLEWDEKGIEKVFYKTLQLLGVGVLDINSVQFGMQKEAQSGNQ